LCNTLKSFFPDVELVVYCKNKEFVKVNTKKCCNPQECFQKIIDLGTPAMTFETFAKSCLHT